MSDPVRVAIVGGGCAAITTAFELTRPELEQRYDVTVYQLGWRLGGKGASGRGRANRIEEHGLHLWMGHYENAFQLMRQCYEELGRGPECPISDWTDAFVPDSYSGVSEVTEGGQWRRFMAHIPSAPGLPGDLVGVQAGLSIPEYLQRATRFMLAMLSTVEEDGDRSNQEGAVSPPATEGVAGSVDSLVESMGRLIRLGRVSSLGSLIQGLSLLESVLAVMPLFPKSLLAGFLDVLSSTASKVLGSALERDFEARFTWEVVDILLASIRGVVRFGLITDPRGFDGINEYDFREWLGLNGASESSLRCGFLRGMYDLAFAYEDGDPDRPRIAAGQALRGAIRMLFTYRGSLFWRMQAGMGDVVFAPFYEVLRRRGVRFEFFHRLENVKLAEATELGPDERPYVSELAFDLQAKVRDGADYEPLVDVKGLPCWPSDPDWSQLENGEKLHDESWKFESAWDRRAVGKKRLRVGRDFDCVVLGVSIGAIPHVCRDFLERDSRWVAMVDNVKTVPIQSFQLWMTEDMRSLGWTGPPPNMSGFVQPFDTWSDMSHLAPAEDWAEEPRSIAYFCNTFPSGPPPPLSESAYPEEAADRVRRDAIRFLNRDVSALWPKADDGNGRFRWEILADAERGGKADQEADESAFDSQFWVVNTSPTDRYVLCLPGSLKHRISPLDITYDNFTITGDWTDCGFDFGCIEAAVMSGRLAAHAVSGAPRLEEIYGFDHP